MPWSSEEFEALNRMLTKNRFLKDVNVGDIQKATDIGALGIIMPTVDTVEKAVAAVRYSKALPEPKALPT